MRRVGRVVAGRAAAAASILPSFGKGAMRFFDSGAPPDDLSRSKTYTGSQLKGLADRDAIDQAADGEYAQHKPRAIMFINRKPVEIIPQEENLIEVMEREGIMVPKFCYHALLSVAGNCRMCMVQVEGTQNVIVACATAVLPGMSVVTDTRLVRDAREGNVELMLINHPNDCPICEQATNCDLQNITMAFGSETPRYREDKRAVQDFYFDPHTRVVLNRCIHCTRCVRYLNEHTQDYNLGMIGRGGLSEIGTYLDELEVRTEHASGAVQLCPVGNLNLDDAEEFNAMFAELEAEQQSATETQGPATKEADACA